MITTLNVSKNTNDVMRKFELFRLGNEVERLHTVRHHGSYSVGKHVADATVIAMELCDFLHSYSETSEEIINTSKVMRHMLLHDMAEQHTGDIPAPTKWIAPTIGSELQHIEDAWHEDNGMLLPSLPMVYSDICKFADGLELALWCYAEYAQMGNRAVCVPFENIVRHMVNRKWDFPPHLARLGQEILEILEHQIGEMQSGC